MVCFRVSVQALQDHSPQINIILTLKYMYVIYLNYSKMLATHQVKVTSAYHVMPLHNFLISLTQSKIESA